MADNAKRQRITPVILSGGSGTRLFPVSTPARPKQFLPLVSTNSMFAETLARINDPAEFDLPIIVGSAAHADLIEADLTAAGMTGASIVLEPVARNTAPAIALAAHAALESATLEANERDPLILVMPSDHAIGNCSAFLDTVRSGAGAAADGWLVTFGITPSGPETGYGYIAHGTPIADRSAARLVDRFVEKPDVAEAESMIAAGGHLWNAGIFLFGAQTYLDELTQHAPAIAAAATAAWHEGRREGGRFYPDQPRFESSPSDSIDYAVMEHAERVATIPIDCGWSDIGSWDALFDHRKDAGMAESAGLVAIDCEGSEFHAEPGVRISAYGARDLIVVATGTDVLIVPRSESQNVKKLLAERERLKR